MSVKVHLNNLHIAPRKVRLVAGLVRGMETMEAVAQLQFTDKRAARPLLKLLNSAVATAKNDFDMAEDNLYIAEVLVNEGPTIKRWRPRAHGRAFPIMKRSSRITIVLDEKVKSKKKKGSAQKAKKKSSRQDVVKADQVQKEASKVKPDKEDSQKTTTEMTKTGQTGPIKQPKGKSTSQSGLLKKVFRRKSI